MENNTTKVQLNPFAHLWQGARALFKVNAIPTLLAILQLTVYTIVYSVALLFIVLKSAERLIETSNGFGDPGPIVVFLATTLGFSLVAGLIYAYFEQFLMRLIVASMNDEKIPFASLYSFAAQRYVHMLLSTLLLGAVIFATVIGVFIAGSIHGALLIAALPAALIFLIIFLLRRAYIFFVVVDDEKPASVKAIMQRSASLWKKSGGALIVLWLSIFIASIVISIVFGSDGSDQSENVYESGNYTVTTTGTEDGLAIGSAIGVAALQIVASVVIYAAMGHIYHQAKKHVDGENPGMQAAGPMPSIQPVSMQPETQPVMQNTMPPQQQPVQSVPAPTVATVAPVQSQPLTQADIQQQAVTASSNMVGTSVAQPQAQAPVAVEPQEPPKIISG